VALIVGAVGVANIMIISVLERRSEIGLRRALGATRNQIRTQFLAEAILLARHRRRRRRAGRGRGNGRVCQLEGLGHRDTRRGVVGRHRLGHPDRRVRWPDAGRSSVSDAAVGGIANGMSGRWISIGRLPGGPRVRSEHGVVDDGDGAEDGHAARKSPNAFTEAKA